MTTEKLILAGFGVGNGALHARAEITLTTVNVQYYRLTFKLQSGTILECVVHASAFHPVTEEVPMR